MKGYNIIILYHHSKEQLLMCKRKKDPYKGMLNFVGGKIEKGEDGLSSAYRELFEETSITKEDVQLTHLMDYTYYLQEMVLEVYVGFLKREVSVVEEENKLCWVSCKENFFDTHRFAGEGNIGHMIEQIKLNQHILEK